MRFTISNAAVCVVGGLHVLFLLGELFPWGSPLIMKIVMRKWPKPLDLSANDHHFAAMIVHNAGIYNGIVAAGLFSTMWVGSKAYPIQVTLLIGGIVAGVFGSATLTKGTIVQAIVGAVALAVVVACRM